MEKISNRACDYDGQSGFVISFAANLFTKTEMTYLNFFLNYLDKSSS